MSDDGNTEPAFGFKLDTAKRLMGLLNESGVSTATKKQQNTFATHIRFGHTTEAINLGSSGTVNYVERIETGDLWSETATTFEAYAWPTGVPDDVDVICFSINGRWVAFEVCP